MTACKHGSVMFCSAPKAREGYSIHPRKQRPHTVTAHTCDTIRTKSGYRPYSTMRCDRDGQRRSPMCSDKIWQQRASHQKPCATSRRFRWGVEGAQLKVAENLLRPLALSNFRGLRHMLYGTTRRKALSGSLILTRFGVGSNTVPNYTQEQKQSPYSTWTEMPKIAPFSSESRLGTIPRMAQPPARAMRMLYVAKK